MPYDPFSDGTVKPVKLDQSPAYDPFADSGAKPLSFQEAIAQAPAGTPDNVREKLSAGGVPSFDEAKLLYSDEEQKGMLPDVSEVWQGVKGVGNTLLEGVKESPQMVAHPLRGASTTVEAGARGTYRMADLVRRAYNKAKDFAVEQATGATREQKIEHFRQRLIANQAYDQQGQGNMLPKPVAEALPPLQNLAEAESLFLDPVTIATMGTAGLPEAVLKAGAQKVLAKAPALAKAADAAIAASRLPGKILSKVPGAVETVGRGIKNVAEFPEKAVKAAVENVLPASLQKPLENLAHVTGAGAVVGSVLGHGGPLTHAMAALTAGQKVGAGMEQAGGFARRLVELSGPSQKPALLKLAQDGTAPEWMRALAGTLHDVGAGTAAEVAGKAATGAVHGAGFGAGLGLATGETQEERSQAIGAGIGLGGVGGTVGHLASAKQRLIQARLGDLADFYIHLKEQGTPDAIIKKIQDNEALIASRFAGNPAMQAATARAVFGDKLNFKFLERDDYAKATEGDPNTAAFFNGDSVIVNVDSPRNALTHELGHAIAKGVGADGEARLMIDSVFHPSELQNIGREYASLMVNGELKNYPQQGRPVPAHDSPEYSQLVDQKIAALNERFKGDRWLYDEIYAEAGFGGMLDKDLNRQVLNPPLWDRLRRSVRERYFNNLDLTPEMPRGALFSNAKVYGPELQEMVKKHFRQIYRDGASAAAAKESREGVPAGIPVPVDLYGKHPAVPVGSDNIIVENGAVRPATTSEINRRVRDRQAAVRAVLANEVEQPKTSLKPEVAPRITPEGDREVSGTRFADQLARLPQFSEDTKRAAKMLESAFGTGNVFEIWYQAIGRAANWAGDVRRRLGNVSVAQIRFAPFKWKVSKEGNVLVEGLSLAAAQRKLASWADKQDSFLYTFWNGDQTAFMADLLTYLRNHAEGKPGSEGLDDKRRDALNTFVIGKNVRFADLNPFRARLVGDEKKGIIRSLRLDRIANPQAVDSGWPAEYPKKVKNLSPSYVYKDDSSEVPQAKIPEKLEEVRYRIDPQILRDRAADAARLRAGQDSIPDATPEEVAHRQQVDRELRASLALKLDRELEERRALGLPNTPPPTPPSGVRYPPHKFSPDVEDRLMQARMNRDHLLHLWLDFRKNAAEWHSGGWPPNVAEKEATMRKGVMGAQKEFVKALRKIGPAAVKAEVDLNEFRIRAAEQFGDNPAYWPNNILNRFRVLTETALNLRNEAPAHTQEQASFGLAKQGSLEGQLTEPGKQPAAPEVPSIDQASGLPSFYQKSTTPEEAQAAVTAKGAAQSARNLIMALLKKQAENSDEPFDAATTNRVLGKNTNESRFTPAIETARRLMSESEEAFKYREKTSGNSPEVLAAARAARASLPHLPLSSPLGRFFQSRGRDQAARFKLLANASEGPVILDRETDFVYKLQLPSFHLSNIEPKTPGVAKEHLLEASRPAYFFDILNKIDRQSRIQGGLPIEVLGLGPDDSIVLKMPRLERDATKAEVKAWLKRYGADTDAQSERHPDSLIQYDPVHRDQPILRDQWGNSYAASDIREGEQGPDRRKTGKFPNFMVDAKGRVFMTDVMLRPIDEADIAQHSELSPYQPKQPDKILYSPETEKLHRSHSVVGGLAVLTPENLAAFGKTVRNVPVVADRPSLEIGDPNKEFLKLSSRPNVLARGVHWTWKNDGSFLEVTINADGQTLFVRGRPETVQGIVSEAIWKRIADRESLETHRQSFATDSSSGYFEVEARPSLELAKPESVEQPLIGSVGDIGQGDLVGGGSDLFSAPMTAGAARAALRKARQKAAQLQQVYPEAVPVTINRGNNQITKVAYDLADAPSVKRSGEAQAVALTGAKMAREVRANLNKPEIAEAKGWYDRTQAKLQSIFGTGADTLGQLLAATSARTGVRDNFKIAVEALRLFSSGQYDDLLSRFVDFTEKGGKLRDWQEVPLKGNGQKFNANSKQVLKVLANIWAEKAGRKTKQFYQNLTGADEGATIDVWAARALRRLMYQGETKKWRLLPAQEKSVSGRDFTFAQKVFADAAKRLSLAPEDVQALMWFVEKDLWERNKWTRGAGAEKSSFDAELNKLLGVPAQGEMAALVKQATPEPYRVQAGVTTFTTPEAHDPAHFEAVRKELLSTLRKSKGLLAVRVHEAEGLYGDQSEPSYDLEATFRHPKALDDLERKVYEVGQRENQNDVFVSRVVGVDHPNARPGIEVYFRRPLTLEQARPILAGFESAGVFGFTTAKDANGRVIGLRSQYIPEIAGLFDEKHLDTDRLAENESEWIKAASSAVANLDRRLVSNVTQFFYDTRVFRKGEQFIPRSSLPGGTPQSFEEIRRRKVSLQRRDADPNPPPGAE